MVDFVANNTQNPLVSGQNTTTRSDKRIFESDGGVLMRLMARNERYFFRTCSRLLERMLNTVPRGVVLSEVITPIAVKPDHIETTVNSDGTMTISGEVRVGYLDH